MPPSVREMPPASMYSPAAAGAEKPHSSAAASSARENGSKPFMVKFSSSIPKKSARYASTALYPYRNLSFMIFLRAARAAFFPILTYAGARDLKDFAEEWENGHKISGEA